ncbi:right-handed parallel beta-helix repeat-containing protein [Hymenobacter wooponensis]|uniref:Right-handed parallel beta-helix repeat-containing protein n=1 Tax=Hymenobacter wooponensis TaxID=1525360 RepID=A0A4Z0MJM7_9BACT|nr:right-handed parallel beta-helix repeat-containing protein [Hymenobacter wooponensis]TGD79669.1 right-handed parallel beta-helix repeat-containing protein [Hymenobacter wooponensis]
MRFKLVLLSVLFVSLLTNSSSALATTYYISSTGKDTNDGTSVATAWNSIAQVNKASFNPGDRVLFEAGKTFTGSLYFTSVGTAADPIKIGSYGQGMATIASGNNYAFYCPNAGGIELHRLKFAGSGRTTTNNSGVIFSVTADLTNKRLSHLVLDSLDVSGYIKTGIAIGSSSTTSGYDNVRITNCQAHDNGEAGISSYGKAPALCHKDWYVADCKAYNNSGRSEITTTNTGSGIVLSSIDGALIEHCETYNNGWLNNNPNGGPVGIWGYICNKLVIQECESHHNRSGLAHDGGGFDLDGGCTNSVMQYNYSHDNDGPGYLLAQYSGAPAMHDLTIRYNISENDARRFGQGAIMLWSSGDNGGIQTAAIHNNTIYLTPAADGSEANAFYLSSNGVSQITVRNNIFQTTAGVPQVKALATEGITFQSNCYWGTGKPLGIKWGGTSFSTLNDWRTATNQEMVGTRMVGVSLDPAFVRAGQGGDMNISSGNRRLLTSWDAYKLQPTSAAIGSGLNLATEFSLTPGSRDFFGSATPAPGILGNLGASESESKPAPLPVELVSFTAERQAGNAVLRWLTASELQNDRFEVESSSDGRVFNRIATVKGNGTTTQTSTYAWQDALAKYSGAMVYYRLKQVDISGKITYSAVKAVTIANVANLEMQAWPNPFVGELSMQIQSPQGGKAFITCTDAMGRTVLTRSVEVTKGASTITLPEVTQLPLGVYSLTVQQGATRVMTKLMHQ